MIKFNNLKGDLFGGVTAGIVALPLALAFGIQAFSGMGAEGAPIGAYAGLVGATLLGFFAALFGGTHSQISGPTGPMTVITATLVTGAFTAPGGSLSTVLVSMALAALQLWSVTTARVMAATASSATMKIHTGTGAW